MQSPTCSYNRDKLAHYGVLASGLGLTALATNSAQADIVFTPVNGGVGLTASNFVLDFVGQAYAIGSSFDPPYTAVINYQGPGFIFASSTGQAPVTRVVENAAPLSFGAPINNTLDFAFGYILDTPFDGYLGFSLDAGGGNFYYGWAHIQTTGSAQFTLFGFAYEDTANTPIGAGVVPEPAHTAALLATGAVGLAALRKRRQQKQAR